MISVMRKDNVNGVYTEYNLTKPNMTKEQRQELIDRI